MAGLLYLWRQRRLEVIIDLSSIVSKMKGHQERTWLEVEIIICMFFLQKNSYCLRRMLIPLTGLQIYNLFNTLFSTSWIFLQCFINSIVSESFSFFRRFHLIISTLRSIILLYRYVHTHKYCFYVHNSRRTKSDIVL